MGAHFDPKFTGILWGGSGLLDLTHPTAAMIHPTDLARGLSRAFRWSGQSAVAYSALAHSLFTERDAEKAGFGPRVRLAVLLHDGTEAWLGTMPRPLKVMVPGFAEIEARLSAAILRRFGWTDGTLSPEEAAAVLWADHRAERIERTLLIPPDAWADYGEDMDPVPLDRLPAWAAAFMRRAVLMDEEALARLFLAKLRELAPDHAAPSRLGG